MADNNTKSIILDVQVDGSQAVKNIADLTKKVNGLRAEQTDLAKTNRELMDTNNELAAENQTLIQTMSELRKNGEDTTEAYRAMSQQVEANRAAMSSNVDAINDNLIMIAALGEEIKTVNKEISSNSKAIQDTVKENQNAAGSYNQLSAQLAQLKVAYKAAGSQEERDAILKNLVQVDEALKEMDEAQGVFVRNVGNYKSAIMGFIPAFDQLNGMLSKVGLNITDMSGSMSKGFDTVNKSLSNLVKAVSSGSGIKAAFADAGKAVVTFGKTLLASPIGWIAAAIAACVAVFMKLKDAIAKNDEAGTNLARLFDTFQPIINAVTTAFATLAGWIGKAAGAIADLFAAMSDGVSEAQALTTAIDNLEEANRQYVVNSAKRNKDIAQLLDEANDKENKSIEERIAALDKAGELRKQNLEDEKAIAEEHLRILEETAAREHDTSDATMDEIANARAAVYKAEENYYKGVKEINSKRIALNQEAAKAEADLAKAEAEAAKKRTEAAKKAAEERRKAEEEAAKKSAEIQRAAEDFALSLLSDETERKIAQRKLQGDREIAALTEQLNTENNLTAEARETLSQLIKDKQSALDNELQKMSDDAAKKRADDAAAKENESAERTAQLRVDAAEKGSKAELDAKIAQLQLAMEAELRNTELTEEQKQLIRQKFDKQMSDLNKEYAEKMKKDVADAMANVQAQIDSAMSYSKSVSDIIGGVFSAISAGEQAEMEEYNAEQEEKKNALQERLDSGLISQETYDAEIQKLEDEKDKKEKEQALKTAKRNKAISLMNAIISTAEGIAKAVAQSPMTGGLPGSAIAAAIGALQIATISAEPLPKASRGALLRGKSHAQGGIPIEAEGGEAIINKRATRRYLPLLSAINESTGGVRLYGGGGVVESAVAKAATDAGVLDYDRLAQACAQMNVSVAVTDINDGQTRMSRVVERKSY